MTVYKALWLSGYNNMLTDCQESSNLIRNEYFKINVP